MKLVLSFLLASALPITLFADTTNDVAKELKILEGTWKSTTLESGGEAYPVPPVTFIVASNGSTIGKSVTEEYQATIKVDPKKNPKTIDILHQTGRDKGKKQFGIYKLDGDKWTVCMSQPGLPEARRPKSFNTTNTINSVKFFERFKPTKPTPWPANAKRFVPTTAAEIEASPEFKLEETTKSGIKCYVRMLSLEEAKAMPQNSPDRAFRGGDISAGEQAYLSAFAYKGKVFSLTENNPDLTDKQKMEIIAWSFKKTFSEHERIHGPIKKSEKK